MVKKTVTKTTKKTSGKKSATPSTRVVTTADDVKMAILLVSVTINVAVFIAWLAIKITTKYDAQVMQFLFDR